MRRSLTVPLAVLLILATLPSLYISVAPALGEQAKLVRTPTDVYSMQPVLVLAYSPSGGVVELEVTASVETRVNTSLPTPPPPPGEGAYRIRMVPVPWAVGWYVAQVPGLPSRTWVFDVRLPLRTVRVSFTVVSRVVYKLLVNGVVVLSDSYVVKELELVQRVPPLTYTFVYDLLVDPGLANETLGLAPRGWVLGEGRTLKVVAVAFDDSSQPEVGLEYRVGEGPWVSLAVTDSPLVGDMKAFVESLSNYVKSVEEWVRQYKPDVEIPRPRLAVRVVEATIPPQVAGTYVMFRATARDADGNSMTSPMGLYYVVREVSDTRVLVVDPHVMLWLLQESLRSIYNTTKVGTDYRIPDEVSKPLKHLENLSRVTSGYSLVQFHHWEILGKYYNLYITWPGKGVAEVLNSFKPNVVVLSSLTLGVEGSATWNWDLRDIRTDGRSLLEYLVSYVKQSHTGIIATHATLSDEVLWLDCEKRVKLGSRGHVGYNLSDLDIRNERTVAALLGMPELALWEYVRDKVAEALCQLSKAYEASQPELAAILKATAIAVGSTSLQVPHVPWDGKLRLTPEAKNLGWDLPEEFELEVPALLGRYGFKAYTEVGWQLAMPRVLAYVALDETSKARDGVARLVGRLTLLYENVTGRTARALELGKYFNRSVEWGLRSFYQGLSRAYIREARLNITVAVPELGRVINLTLDIGREALVNLLQRLPAKVVALSPNGLAGVVAYDKYWDPEGYRSVYFSFEVEASKGDVVEELLVNAVEWVKRWQYRDVTELLGNVVRVPKGTASRFREVAAGLPGRTVLELGLLLNEEGGSEVELSVVPGRLHIVVAHPTTDSVNIGVARGLARVVNVTQVGARITQVTVVAERTGTVVLSLRAGSDAALNAAYVTVKQEVAPTTTPATVTVTVTTTTTATVTTATTTTYTTTATVATTYTTVRTLTISTTVTTATTVTSTETYTTTATVPLTRITTAYETLVRYETLTKPTTIVAERTVERTTAVSVATPTTVYYREIEWGTAAGLSVALLIVGIVIGRLITRRK